MNTAHECLRRWLRGCDLSSAADKQMLARHKLRWGTVYIDELTLAGRLKQTLALKYGRTVLTTHSNSHPFGHIAREEGFDHVVIKAKVLKGVRSSITGVGVPTRLEALSISSRLRTAGVKFPDISGGLDAWCRDALIDARIISLFARFGSLTHALIQSRDDRASLGDWHSVARLLSVERDADTAILKMMKMPETNIVIKEIW